MSDIVFAIAIVCVTALCALAMQLNARRRAEVARGTLSAIERSIADLSADVVKLRERVGNAELKRGIGAKS